MRADKNEKELVPAPLDDEMTQAIPIIGASHSA